MNITGGLCSWLACSLIKLEVSGGFFDWSKCFLGFARFTLSLQYIYTRWSLSACSCSLHTLSPSPDLNKTSLASLSPHCCSKSRQDPSAGKGRRLNAVAVGEGGNPLPAQLFTFTQRRRGRASDPFFFAAVPSPTEPRPKNLKV